MPSVRVVGIPAWVDADRLLGVGDWSFGPGEGERRVARADLDVRDAADLEARLRGVGLDGRALELMVEPRLPRAAVRAARTADARRRRDTTPGFERKGALLDDEGKISLTPESIAMAIASSARGRPVIDATAGCGGDAIAFARCGSRVVAIERDPARLEMAKHNARLYGVADRIDFLEGDARDLVTVARGEILFVDPPWGADWDRARTRLSDLPLLADLVARAPRTTAGELWAKVPPSFEVATLPGAAPAVYFGEAPGDRRRVKLVLLRSPIQR
jgi:hypothetical protein